MSTKVKKTANLFLSGVVVLTIANLLVKVIGLGLKVPLTKIIETNGMGYYTSAYDIYVWLYMVSTAGIPVAISIMISDSRSKGNFRQAKKIFKIALWSFVVIGLAGMCIMIFGSQIFSKLYKLPELYWSIIAIAPTLLFICISSAIRGYFQGYQNMTPTAVSEVIESFGKLILGIAFALWSMKFFADPSGAPSESTYAKAAAMTILGLTVGVFVSMIYLIIKKKTFREDLYNAEFVRPDSDMLEVKSGRSLLKTLVVIAVPITISASMMSFTNMLDGMIIANRLSGLGFDTSVISGMIGAFKTQVVTFFNLPPALIYPISASLVPYISTVRNTGTKQQLDTIMNSAVKITSLLAMPCALGMSVLSEPIIDLMFDMSKNPEAMSFGTPALLSVQALAVFFLGMLSITNSFLQSHSLERKPIISILAGSAVKLITSFFLIGNPDIQILGAPIGTLLCYITIVVFNFYFVAKHIGFVPKFGKVFIRPLLASIVCAAAAFGSFKVFTVFLPSKIAVLAAILAAVLVYAVAVLLFRAITEDELKMLPKGEKIANKLRRIGIMK
ncbi:MAG: polysaccharide biosynthesis protein [Clostridia bacterium]|nr:polysaccharide biosynthesis protein [Clostridia bacterium]